MLPFCFKNCTRQQPKHVTHITCILPFFIRDIWQFFITKRANCCLQNKRMPINYQGYHSLGKDSYFCHCVMLKNVASVHRMLKNLTNMQTNLSEKTKRRQVKQNLGREVKMSAYWYVGLILFCNQSFQENISATEGIWYPIHFYALPGNSSAAIAPYSNGGKFPQNNKYQICTPPLLLFFNALFIKFMFAWNCDIISDNIEVLK